MLEQVKVQEIPEVQIPVRIQQQTVLERIEEQVWDVPAPPIVDDTVEIHVTERIQEQIGPVRIEELVDDTVELQTTLNTADTSSSSSTSTRCDELENMLDSCIVLLSPLAALTESIEKETERVAMLTKRMLEPRMMEPRMMEPPMMEPERASAKRRRRTRYTPLLGIMENAVHLAPSAWPQSDAPLWT